MLSAGRAAQLQQGLNSTAKKVLASISATEPWNMARIEADLRDLGVRLNSGVATGCVHHLVKLGLVRHVGLGQFQRAQVRHAATAAAAITNDYAEEEDEVPSPAAPMPAAGAKPALKPTEQIGAIAGELRKFGGFCLDAADRLDEAALAIEDETAKTATDLATLRQLQALLGRLQVTA